MYPQRYLDDGLINLGYNINWEILGSIHHTISPRNFQGVS